MGRSSRILVFLSLGASSFGLASFGLGAAAMADGQRPMVRMPTIVRPPAAHAPLRARISARILAQRPVQRIAAMRGSGRIGSFGRRNGAGLYGVGLGLSLASDLAAPPAVVPADYGPGPELLYAAPLPACVRPQVIKIGLGARHDRPRVIYGPPTGCRL